MNSNRLLDFVYNCVLTPFQQMLHLAQLGNTTFVCLVFCYKCQTVHQTWHLCVFTLSSHVICIIASIHVHDRAAVTCSLISVWLRRSALLRCCQSDAAVGINRRAERVPDNRFGAACASLTVTLIATLQEQQAGNMITAFWMSFFLCLPLLMLQSGNLEHQRVCGVCVSLSLP